MEILQEWLSPETAYLESEAFLAAMEKAAAPVDRDATRDAAGLFDSLLGPLDELRLSTRLWTQFFVEEGAAESIDASPAEAREYALKRLRLVDQVPGHLVSTLAEASFRLGRYAEAELATTVAYLAGDRSPA
ncbi:MAG: hypothetical protein HY900_38195, partial [Deltaproteobacteria bacterium]|nr:hypothetical protein [Deltaproteobacteria bacterium]